MPVVLAHRISRPHRKIRRFGDGWQSGFAKSALPVSGRNEAIEIAEMLSVTPPFEDLGATHKSLKASRQMWDKGDVVLDADNFVGAEFSCDNGMEIEADKPIEVLLVEPGQYARMATIGSSLEDMQKVVGGYIQEAPFFRDPVTLVCNEEGKISGLPLNRAIRDDDGKIIDIVAGTFFICGAEGDHFSSIPKELQKKYEEKFKKPEAFLKMGRSIMAIPTEPAAANPKPDKKAPGMEL